MTVIPITNAPRLVVQETVAAVQILTLPVAPQAFCRLRFAPEIKNDQALTPTEALTEVSQHQGLAGVTLTGPGDPLASLPATLTTIAFLKRDFPSLAIGVTTLGIGGEQHAVELAAAGVNSVTLLVDTMEPATVEKLYAWIRPGKKTLPLDKTVPLLLDEQSKAVPALSRAGITVTIRTTIYPGINAHQVVTIAQTMAELGAASMELVPYIPDTEQPDAPIPPTRVHMEQIGKLTSQYLSTITHQVAVADCGCSTGNSCSTAQDCGCSCGSKTSIQTGLPKPSAARPRVAVASTTGMDVDLHLGQAKTLLIYGPRADGLTCLLETRQAPEPGSGENRWDQLAEMLHDCFALLAASAGQRPREVLAERGIRVILTEDNIEGTVDVLYGGGKKGKCKK